MSRPLFLRRVVLTLATVLLAAGVGAMNEPAFGNTALYYGSCCEGQGATSSATAASPPPTATSARSPQERLAAVRARTWEP